MNRLYTSMLFLACAVCGPAHSEDYADEAKDWGVSAMSRPKSSPHHATTPLQIPGAKLIKTDELKTLWTASPALVVIDVLGNAKMIKGAVGMVGSGEDRMFGTVKDKFPKVLDALTGGDKEKPIVFYCKNSMCWMSYNSALHAVAAGFKNVYWYRGGLDSWVASTGETSGQVSAAGW
jgi:rhodanese-related sulfurtransferase